MRKARIDANQPRIVSMYRSVGANVLHTHQLKNCCDLIVTFRGRTFYVEIKDPKTANFPKSFWELDSAEREAYLVMKHLTKGEADFRDEVRARKGEYWIVYDLASVRESLGFTTATTK